MLPHSHSRLTKIICTLGPATDSDGKLAELIRAGANVFRINMSHAQHEWVRDLIHRIRHQAECLEANVAVLVDLQGPSIRTGDLPAPLELKVDDRLEIRLSQAAATLPYSTTVNYDGLMEDVSVGNTIVVDNGNLLMEIEKKTDDYLICRVLTEGSFGSRRHINLPGVVLRLPALTEKDLSDLELAVECETDYIAMSFVRDAGHIRELRDRIAALKGHAQIIAKIEDQQAMRNIDDIILAADVIMVARGDLGIEVSIEELPIVQRLIVRHCHRLGRRYIIATHMLESMINQPTPTRAEVTDVSNAVYEMADAVMLSGETSVGLYPIRCVETLNSIAQRMEPTGHLDFASSAPLETDRQKSLRAAVNLADSVHGACLVVFSHRGYAATLASLLRPERTPIFAFSNNPSVVRQLSLARGVMAFESPFCKDSDRMIKAALGILRQRGLVQPGQAIIMMGDSLQDGLLADSIIFLRAQEL